jgi:hypothetical protein
MKKKVGLLFFLLSTHIFAQRILNFKIFQVNQAVFLNFILSKGSSCNGFNVLHSTDSVNFKIIHEDPTICGTSNADEAKNWTHANPTINQLNYYKIQLNPGEMSPVNRIFVNQTNKPNIVLFPNPISTDIDLLTIKILGTESLAFDGFIYNQFGNYVLKIEKQSTISNSTIKINELSNGLYLIKLTDGYNLYSTKFIIQR